MAGRWCADCAAGRVRPEYGVATLLASSEDPPLLDRDAPAVPLARATAHFVGRDELLDQLGRQLAASGAVAGAVAVAAVEGLGGFGKTILAVRLVLDLLEPILSLLSGRTEPRTSGRRTLL